MMLTFFKIKNKTITSQAAKLNTIIKTLKVKEKALHVNIPLKKLSLPFLFFCISLVIFNINTLTPLVNVPEKTYVELIEIVY